MDMPQLLPQNQALTIIAGTWIGHEQIHPSPFDPAGGPAVGRVINRVALDGFAVIQDYEQERNGKVNFRGHGIFRWDRGDSCYKLHWFDSAGQAPVEYQGSLEAGVLILTAPQGPGFARASFDFSQDGKYLYRMEVSPDGNQWFVFMDGEYQRNRE
jgi:hypothetical protein